MRLEDNSVWNSRDLLINTKSFAAELPVEQPNPAAEPDAPIDVHAPEVAASEEESEGPRNQSEPSVLESPKDQPLLGAEEPVRRSARERHPPARYKDFVKFL